MDKIVFADMDEGGQVVQCEALLKMVFDVAADDGALPAGFAGGGNKGHGKAAVTHQKQQDDFEKILTDGIIAGLLLLDFFQEAPQIKEDLFTDTLGVDNGTAALRVIT